MLQVDLNCDLGESFGSYTLGLDDEVISFISSANIACGWHASDPLVMEHTVALAKKAHVAVGAHPGFPDLMGFGRRSMAVTPAEAKTYMTYQIGALYGFCKAHDLALRHVKPHGALYNMAAADYQLAKSLCEAICEFDPQLILLGLANSEMIHAAKAVGIRSAQEVFADRAYEDDGSLVNRRKEGAVIKDSKLAIERVVRMVREGKVTSISGKDVDIQVDSICVHGDNTSALEFVKEIRKALMGEQVEICPLHQFVK